MGFIARYAIVIVTLIVAPAAIASEGQSEINQTCAVQTGCLAGDTAGFPVTITTPGSYRLTGDLTVTTDVDGIQISASYVTIDLAGFEIAGTNACTGTGVTLSCGTGAGAGVETTGTPTGITVRNGIVRNHPSFGVGLGGKGHRIEGVTARHNGDHGIVADPRSSCRSCTSIENGGDGIRLNSAGIIESSTAFGNAGEGIKLRSSGGVVNGCTSSGNGGNGIQFDASGGTVFGSGAYWNEGAGFSLAELSKFGVNNVSLNNTGTDSCGGGICTEKKRFYQTAARVPGGGLGDPPPPVEAACDTGFRPAYLTDLTNRFSGYEYDPRASAKAVPNTAQCSWIRSTSVSNPFTIAHRNFTSGGADPIIERPGGAFDDWIRYESDDVRAFMHGAILDGFSVGPACSGVDPFVWCVEE